MALRSTLVPVLACFALVSTAACGTASSVSDESTAPSVEQAASTTVSVRVPLLEESTVTRTVNGRTTRVRTTRLLEKRNAQAAANGIAPFPKFVTITRTSGVKAFNDAMDRVSDLNEKLPDDDQIEMVAFGAGNEYQTGRGATAVRLCYTGDAKKAIDLMNTQLGDSVLSDQFSLIGWRYKTGKFNGESVALTDADESEMWGDDAPELWKEWRGQGEAILMISAIGDDGTDMNETIIPKCR